MTLTECKEAKERATSVYLAMAESGIEQGIIINVHEESKDCPVGSFVVVRLADGRKVSRFAREIALTESGAKETSAWQIRHMVKTLERSIETKDDLIRFLFREPVDKNPQAREAVIRFARDRFQIYLS